MGYRPCPNCDERLPRYRAVCYNCSYLVDGNKFERRLQVEILNELRVLNGKREVTHDELRLTKPVESVKEAYASGNLDVGELESELAHAIDLRRDDR